MLMAFEEEMRPSMASDLTFTNGQHGESPVQCAVCPHKNVIDAAIPLMQHATKSLDPCHCLKRTDPHMHLLQGRAVLLICRR